MIWTLIAMNYWMIEEGRIAASISHSSLPRHHTWWLRTYLSIRSCTSCQVNLSSTWIIDIFLYLNLSTCANCVQRLHTIPQDISKRTVSVPIFFERQCIASSILNKCFLWWISRQYLWSRSCCRNLNLILGHVLKFQYITS